MSVAGNTLTFCAHERADRYQLRFFGTSSARSFKQPTRKEWLSGLSVSADELTGAPQLGQNECLRFEPLSAVLT